MGIPISPEPAGGAAGAFRSLVLIDLLKALAAQLIVLHHLAFYGPMSDHVRPVMPILIHWLDEHARIAVQVFLVVGGFLAAKSLCSQGNTGSANPLASIMQRYRKLVPPFMVAIVLAVAASAWASRWITHDSISPPPGILQLVAHAFLLHDILEYEALSAGAWYVAIDFQLYVLLTCLLWLAGRIFPAPLPRYLLPVVVVTGICASLLHFNRDPRWDIWAAYFFGSYGLGILAWWASDPARQRSERVLLLAMMLLPAMLALLLDFRSRIAVALAVACMLALLGRVSPTGAGRWRVYINSLGKISYAVFLVHFPVCLVINAAFTRFIPAEPHVQALGMASAWLASLMAGAAFYRYVELPLERRLAPGRLRTRTW